MSQAPTRQTECPLTKWLRHRRSSESDNQSSIDIAFVPSIKCGSSHCIMMDRNKTILPYCELTKCTPYRMTNVGICGDLIFFKWKAIVRSGQGWRDLPYLYLHDLSKTNKKIRIKSCGKIRPCCHCGRSKSPRGRPLPPSRLDYFTVSLHSSNWRHFAYVQAVLQHCYWPLKNDGNSVWTHNPAT